MLLTGMVQSYYTYATIQLLIQLLMFMTKAEISSAPTFLSIF